MQLTGHVVMPKELETLLHEVGAEVQETPIVELNPITAGRNNRDYLTSIPRKVDIMLMCVFYGIYSSKQLPPLDKSEHKCNGTYEFNVRIEGEVHKIKHILLLIWISQNGIGTETDLDYKRKLYSFIETISDVSYLTKVVFPFYLEKSNEQEGDLSFITKLANSRYIEWKMHPYAPERLALEFIKQKEVFNKHMKKALSSIMK